MTYQNEPGVIVSQVSIGDPQAHVETWGIDYPCHADACMCTTAVDMVVTQIAKRMIMYNVMLS